MPASPPLRWSAYIPPKSVEKDGFEPPTRRCEPVLPLNYFPIWPAVWSRPCLRFFRQRRKIVKNSSGDCPDRLKRWGPLPISSRQVRGCESTPEASKDANQVPGSNVDACVVSTWGIGRQLHFCFGVGVAGDSTGSSFRQPVIRLMTIRKATPQKTVTSNLAICFISKDFLFSICLRQFRLLPLPEHPPLTGSATLITGLAPLIPNVKGNKNQDAQNEFKGVHWRCV